ncbi:hypothetical protein RMN57_13170 [Kitasatospora sp. CM 4170]|uniref:BON domain-containing protein n=1 Tax=Kitasatospora aburaviensis TaxID=67265 RepID=A0ABW1F5D1_9ACTN|nr:hypothetical protein [Kitasatospora sp. CM 4170]WNM45605.1 hypothetical protein RMN57_13170 [Kitasatospora sp. CM 4170]
MPDTQRYEAQVDIRTASGEKVTVQADGVGPAGVTGDQLLSGVEAAARDQYPGATIEASRVRTANR